MEIGVMTKLIVFSLLALAAPLATASAADSRPAGGLTPAETIAARQAAYGLSGGAMGAMKAAIDAGAEVKPMTFTARMIGRWARTLPTMFPAGTDIAPTHAKAEVWSDRAGFEQKAAAYAAAADKLAAFAQANDKPGFAQQWVSLRQTCQACHDAYKKADD
jgi:cytochrome c556